MTAKAKLQVVIAMLLLHAVISSDVSAENSGFHGVRKEQKGLKQQHNQRASNVFSGVNAPLKEKPFRSDAALCVRQCRRKVQSSRKLRQRCINQCKIRRCNRRIAGSRPQQIEGQSVEMVRFFVQISPDDDMSNPEEDEHFTVILREEWSPIGCARFKELVDSCFFDGSPFFRVINNFVAQFGISSDKRLNRKYAYNEIEDDPSLPHARNEMGTLSFATSGENSRTTQIFVNLSDNYSLDSQGFTPFATIQDGWDVVQRLYSKYGDDGPSQGVLISKGSKVAFKDFPMLSRIIRVEYL